MHSTETFIYHATAEDGIATVALNRPEKNNAIIPAMIDSLMHILQELAQDKKTKILVLSGKGAHFCAGADIAWMREMGQASAEHNQQDAEKLASLLYQLYTFPKPTIALVQGITLGGGMGIVACCDIAYAAQNATFGFSEVKIGLTPSVISPYVIKALGERAARYYFLTGERFPVSEAHRHGLIHHVVEPDFLQQAGLSLAHLLLKNSPNGLREAKNLIRLVAHEKITPELSKITAKHLASVRQAKDAEEGLTAFLQKRPAEWPEGK